VAHAEEGSRGGQQGLGRERMTRGGHLSRRWSGGGNRAAARSEALHRQQEEQSRAARAEEKEKWEGVRGAFLKILEISGTSQ
jgi:hypothetical protein